jgi:curved DNA-binding protein CbpA
MMNLNSRIFDRIRVKPEPQIEASPAQTPCDQPGCKCVGEFRAPMGRMREGRYFNFCLQHVREYNQSYNYFNGMTDDDVAQYQKDAVIGHRPTWTMGAKRGNRGFEADPNGFVDPLGVFKRQTRAAPEPPRPRHGIVAAKALAILGLDDTSGAEAIKTRYKELVKRLHPDANGGDRSSEDKLREIIQAYKQLKSAGLA